MNGTGNHVKQKNPRLRKTNVTYFCPSHSEFTCRKCVCVCDESKWDLSGNRKKSKTMGRWIQGG